MSITITPAAQVALLAVKSYNPSGGVVTKTFTSTPTAIDTTNMRATFTAPVSGNVVVKMGGGRLLANNSNPHLVVLDGATVKASQIVAAANVGLFAPFASFLVTGLTPGTSYSFDFGIMDTNLTSASTLQYGYATSNPVDGTGPVILEVWTAP